MAEYQLTRQTAMKRVFLLLPMPVVVGTVGAAPPPIARRLGNCKK
jgi:hypothetical protein